jgi:hypothetical protein
VRLRQGIALGLAPRFQSALAWSDRVQVNEGIETDAGHVYPRRHWRGASDDELRLLLAGGESAAPVGLLNLPAHVRREWWALAEGGVGLPGGDGPYRAFVDRVLEFLRFKRLPLPDRCRVDVLVSRPGQPSTRWDPASGRPGGLTFGTEAGHSASHRVAGVINLGDEPTHRVLLNLTPSAMADMLERPRPPGSTPEPDLVGRFFAALPDYPLVRVRLEPGDGLWFADQGLVHDGWTLDKQEVDVALTIRVAGART